MALDRDTLEDNLKSVFDKASDVSNGMTVYDVAKEIVESIIDKYISGAELVLKQPGVNNSGTDVDFNVDGESVSVASFASTGQRVALEASLISSFFDPGDDNFGRPGLRVFAQGSQNDDDTKRWEDAVREIVINQGRNFGDSDSLEDTAADIISNFSPGYPFYITTLVSWGASAGYATAIAASLIPDDGESLFSNLETKMIENANTQASTQNAAQDMADALDDATKSATVTSSFTNSAGGFAQASPETQSII
tara:strand:+ start:135 stop:890 length:756 start_codon:yes stop_codon:yes gene_type:complete